MDPIIGAAIIGGLFNMIGGAVNKPKIPKQPSFGPSAYGAQNPAIMQMLQGLTTQQSAEQAGNKQMQQQILQQLMQAMMMQGMFGQGQSSPQGGGSIGPIPSEFNLNPYTPNWGGRRPG